MTETDAPTDETPMTLDELAAAVDRLRSLRGVELTQAARVLARSAPVALRAAGDRGVWEATRKSGPEGAEPWAGLSHEEVAVVLDVGLKRVERAVSRHGARLRGEQPKG